MSNLFIGTLDADSNGMPFIHDHKSNLTVALEKPLLTGSDIGSIIGIKGEIRQEYKTGDSVDKEPVLFVEKVWR